MPSQELNKMLDSSLAEVGFSSKTKALRAYFLKGLDHPKLQEIAQAVAPTPEVPVKHIVSFSAMVLNHYQNASRIPGTTEFGNSAQFKQFKLTVKACYKAVKPGTLERWMLAIRILDELRRIERESQKLIT